MCKYPFSGIEMSILRKSFLLFLFELNYIKVTQSILVLVGNYTKHEAADSQKAPLFPGSRISSTSDHLPRTLKQDMMASDLRKNVKKY